MNKGKILMDKRPIFSDKLSVKDFEKYYWYKDELVKICRKNNLPSYGTKAELNQYIVSFLLGNPVKQFRYQSRNTKVLKDEDIYPNTRLLESNFKLNREARNFFADYFDMEKFSFKKSMAVKLRMIQSNQDTKATVQDLIDAYLLKNQEAQQTSEENTYQWNNFVKDFNKDEFSQNYSDRMKVAAILWQKVRDSAGNKKYRHSLMVKYHKEIAIYEKLI